MPIDVINGFLVNTGILDREVDAAGHPESVRPGVRHMVGIARQPATEVLSDDVGAALLGMCQRLKDENACPLSHYESITILIPRPEMEICFIVQTTNKCFQSFLQ